MAIIKNPLSIIKMAGGGAKVAHGEVTFDSDQSVAAGSGPVITHNLGQKPDFIMVYTMGAGARNDFIALCYYKLASLYYEACFAIQVGAQSGAYNYLLMTLLDSENFITMDATTFRIRGVNSDGKIRSGVRVKWVAGTFS